MNNYGIYIHIPFCIKKCLYCDFTSYAGHTEIYEKYIDSLIGEMNEYSGKKADTVFIGGGTPTILPPYLLEKLLFHIHSVFSILPDAEISIEANPKTLNKEKILLLKKYVNRVSIGVQSFNDNELAALGRIYSAADAVRTISDISTSFENFNIDLISSIPFQTPASFEKTLRTAVRLSPAHISCYSLIVEEKTPLYNMVQAGEINLPDEDFDRDMYAFAGRFLAEHGYSRYEISNYAKPGYECRHNLKYWNTDEYLGFGAAAHSYAGGRRYFNSGDLDGYFARSSGSETLSRNDMMSEFVFMGMRKSSGISEQEFERRFSVSIYDVYGAVLREKIEKGLIIRQDDRLFLSDRGIDISNYVLCDFVL